MPLPSHVLRIRHHGFPEVRSRCRRTKDGRAAKAMPAGQHRNLHRFPVTMRLRFLSLLAKLFRPKGAAPEDALGIDRIALEPPVITRTLSPGEIPIGRLDCECPNCGVVLVKRPRGKTRCRSCQKYIWVRWNTEGQQVLLSEEMLEPFNRQKYGDDETNKAVESISVDPELTPKMRATIRKMLTDFLLQSGAGIPAARIPALQQQIQASVFAGDRSDRIRKMLQTDFGLAQHLAARIAAQADSLLVSKWRELRARDAGCTRYNWSTSHDERVCPRCRALQGKIFSWDNPPEGGHPGECECWRLVCPDYAKVPVGRLDSRCPNCEVELPSRPRGKTKCRSCKKSIWVRTNSEGHQVLLSEEMLADFDRQEFGPETCRCIAMPIIEW